MFVRTVPCPHCGEALIVDAALSDSGIDLHCPECGHFFASAGDASLSPAEICGASVPINIWRSDATDD